MTDRLSLYNGALVEHLGERRLADLSENREPRRVLDDIWDGGAVRYCLEQGYWNFAMRTVRIDYDPSIEPQFGHRRAFDRPDDFVRLAAISADEYFDAPLTAYRDEAGRWFADLDILYVRYVSDDPEYGMDLARWPQTFAQWVQAYLALKACARLTGSKVDKESLKKDARRLLVDARSKDAMNEGARFLPPGGWTLARTAGSARRRDRHGGVLVG